METDSSTGLYKFAVLALLDAICHHPYYFPFFSDIFRPSQSADALQKCMFTYYFKRMNFCSYWCLQ